MTDIYDRLRGIEYFGNRERPLPSGLQPFCVEESSWPKLYTAITSEYGEDWLLNAQNDLTAWLSANARHRYGREWNSTVQHARPLIKSIVEDAIRSRFPNDQWDEPIGSHVSSCLLGIVMADHYSDLRRSHAPLGFHDRLLAILEAGYLPAGWQSEGEWPKGKFLIGRIPPAGVLLDVPSLSVEQMVEEGRRLARPTWILRRTTVGSPAAIWRGESDAGAHWITVAWDEFGSPFGMQGSTSIVESDYLTFVVEHEQPGSHCVAAGTPLFAHLTRPLPPPFVLEQESEAIQSWIASKDPARQAKFDAYVEAFQTECPLYQQDENVYAAVSSWPIEINKGEWSGRYRADSQLLLTFKDAEPWVELVRHRDGSLSARGIIT